MIIVATAGHIDHGKTALVRALTGVDTDRLPEEKARGISIDLGFAYGATASGASIGYVDVPGHERFIRNMLAGVAAIDFVLVVVAADDGPMPQTLEHLQIVDLLGVRRGLGIVTKTDRVAPARVDAVVGEVRALFASTALAGVDVLAVSTLSGAGIDDLRARLDAAAAQRVERARGDGLRYTVDRAFSVAGSGSVVTGTVIAGAVAVGDRLVLSPSGVAVRVRAIQQHGGAVARVGAGERCALNLGGVGVDDVHRGDWVLDPALHAPTRELDVELRLLPQASAPLRHWTPVHVHLGTADVTARIAIARGGALEPGASAPVRVTLERPIVAAHGDPLVVRDQSATRTLGGGVVVDPQPPRQRRVTALRLAQLDALRRADPAEALRLLASCSPAGLDVGAFRRSFNRSVEAMQGLLDAGGWQAVGKEADVALPRAVIERLVARIDEVLAPLHAGNASFAGIKTDALRRAVAAELDSERFAALLRHVVKPARLELKGSLVRSVAHAAAENPVDLQLWQRVRGVLEAAGFAGLDVAALARASRSKEAILRDMLHRRAQSPELFLIGPDAFVSRRTLAAFAAQVRAVAAASDGGRFTAAAVRDAVGISRARTVQLLECLDRVGITLRNGNVRVQRRPFEDVIGTPD